VLYICIGSEYHGESQVRVKAMALEVLLYILIIGGTLRTFYINTPDGIKLGAWHILPRRLAPLVPTTTLSQYYIDNIANETLVQKDMRFESALPKAKRVFLYFHGNAGNRATFTRPHMYKIMTNIAQMDSHVISIDYRGFGDSSWVTPTEVGIQTDSMAAYNYLISLGVEAKRIIIVGHSLGSGVAAHLSAALSLQGVPSGGLVLLSAYASIPGIILLK